MQKDDSARLISIQSAIEALRARSSSEQTTVASLEEVDPIVSTMREFFRDRKRQWSPHCAQVLVKSLDYLIKYVQSIARHTRRRQQCEELLIEWRAVLLTEQEDV
ncbi:hypothetical protein PINS_up008789 [Pythium insidiosum]|nr:hypothetical protein PINS_up008789 [Pythium insidiosum]